MCDACVGHGPFYDVLSLFSGKPTPEKAKQISDYTRGLMAELRSNKEVVEARIKVYQDLADQARARLAEIDAGIEAGEENVRQIDEWIRAQGATPTTHEGGSEVDATETAPAPETTEAPKPATQASTQTQTQAGSTLEPEGLLVFSMGNPNIVPFQCQIEAVLKTPGCSVVGILHNKAEGLYRVFAVAQGKDPEAIKRAALQLFNDGPCQSA